MSTKTLLQIVQAVTVELDLDPVESIEDTPEALQIAQIVSDVFDEIVAKTRVRDKYILQPLIALSDNTKPTHMKLPDGTQELAWIKYDVRKLSANGRKSYSTLKYLQPDDFLYKIQGRNNLDTNVDVVIDFGGSELLIVNDAAPSYWTSFDDTYVVFDSFDSEVDTTLQDSKSQAFLRKEVSMVIHDTTIPELPSDSFPFLITTTKSRAMLAINQEINPLLNQESERQRRAHSRRNWKAHGGINFPDFGRKR